MASKGRRSKGRGGGSKPATPVPTPPPRSASESPANRFQPSQAYLARIGQLPAPTPTPPPDAAVLPPSPAIQHLAAAAAAAASWRPALASAVLPAWEAQQQQETPPVVYSFPQALGPTLPPSTSVPPHPLPSLSPLPPAVPQASSYPPPAALEAFVEAAPISADESSFVAPFAFPPDSAPPIQPEYAEEVQVDLGPIAVDGEPSFLSPALLDLPESLPPLNPALISPPPVPSHGPVEYPSPPPELELPYGPFSFPPAAPSPHSPSENLYDSDDDDAESYQSEVLIQEQLVGPRSAPASIDGDARMDDEMSAAGSSSDGGETQDNELDFGSESDEDELYIEEASGRDEGSVRGEENSPLVVEDQPAGSGRAGEEDEEDLEYEMLYGAREEKADDGRARKRRRIDSDAEEEEEQASTAGDFSRPQSVVLQEEQMTGSEPARSRAGSFDSPPPAPPSLLRRAFAFATSTPNGTLPAVFSPSATIDQHAPEASTSRLPPSFLAHAHDAFGQGSQREVSPGAGLSSRRASQSLSPVFGTPNALLRLPADSMALDSPSAGSNAAGDVSLGEDMEMSFADLPAEWVGDPSKRNVGAIAIPLGLQRPLQKASYQRRVDLSATPLETPVAGQAKIHNAPSQLSYKPSPLQLASAVATSTASRSSTPTTSKAAYVRPEAKPDPVKAAYERPIGGIVPPPQPKPSKPKKAPGALPLSHEEKTISLPRKLALAFPNELDADSALSPHLYSPANLITTAKGSKGPAEGVLHGFWPAPPPRNSGKEIYPAPLVLPGTIAPEDDKRPRVDVFVDNSNILYSFLNWVRARPEAKVGSFVGMSGGKTKVSKTVTLAGKKVKMDYDVLFAILERGRRVEKRILAGSSPLWQSLDASINWGYEVSVLQRVPRAIAPLPQSRAIKSKPAPQSYPPPPPKGAIYPPPNGATYPPPHGAVYPPPPINAPQSYANGAPQAYPPPPNGAFVPVDGSKKRAGSRGNGRPRNVEKVGKGSGKGNPDAQNVAVATKEAKHYKEQAVDELIHLKVLESLLDFTPDPTAPCPLLVLATGDANSSEYNPTGFMGCARRALERGWDVEIVAFPLGTSSSWLSEQARQALEVGEGGEGVRGRGRLSVVNLELFAEELVG